MELQMFGTMGVILVLIGCGEFIKYFKERR